MAPPIIQTSAPQKNAPSKKLATKQCANTCAAEQKKSITKRATKCPTKTAPPRKIQTKLRHQMYQTLAPTKITLLKKDIKCQQNKNQCFHIRFLRTRRVPSMRYLVLHHKSTRQPYDRSALDLSVKT